MVEFYFKGYYVQTRLQETAMKVSILLRRKTGDKLFGVCRRKKKRAKMRTEKDNKIQKFVVYKIIH